MQIKPGVGIELSPRITVAPEYRFIWVNSSGNGVRNTSIHSVGAALRVHF